MIFQVLQTNAAGRNTFDVVQNNFLVYRGEASWFPMGVDKTNKFTLSDPAGNLFFESKYSVIENLAESSIPLKYLVTGQQKFGQYQIMNTNGQQVGALYEVQNALMDTKLCMSFGDRVILGYNRYVGDYDVVSLYENDNQIGQITHSLKVVNNLDVYFVHILPQYDELLPLFALLTVYYDYQEHNHSGQAFVGTKVSKSYTWDKNNAKYNKNFIKDNFGEAESNLVDGYMKRKVEMRAGGLTMKRFWLIFGIGWGIALLGAAILIFVLWQKGLI